MTSGGPGARTVLYFLDGLYYLSFGDGTEVNVQVVSVLNFQWVDN